jgi:protein-tyrosine phosphatase
MYDLHAHILAGADDGPVSWEESLAMLKTAEADGIRGIALTPHVIPGLHDNPKEKVLRLVAELKARASGIPVELYPASELKLTIETLEGIKSGALCTINNSRYFLSELPRQFEAQKIEELMLRVKDAGLVPLIAHPERNQTVLKDVECLYRVVKAGALTQVTGGSFLGEFGEDVRLFSLSLLERKLVHVIASDAHDNGPRPPKLSAAIKEAAKVAGEKAAREMAESTPEKIIKDEPFNPAEPVHPKKPLFFFSDMPFFD